MIWSERDRLQLNRFEWVISADYCCEALIKIELAWQFNIIIVNIYLYGECVNIFESLQNWFEFYSVWEYPRIYVYWICKVTIDIQRTLWICIYVFMLIKYQILIKSVFVLDWCCLQYMKYTFILKVTSYNTKCYQSSWKYPWKCHTKIL